MEVPVRLRAARRAAGLTQAELAERVGVDRVSIGRYEAGAVTPAADTYLRILAACRRNPPARLDDHDVSLLEAQLARTPEGRLHASQELARMRAAVRG